jgi:hypothetical protein
MVQSLKKSSTCQTTTTAATTVATAQQGEISLHPQAKRFILQINTLLPLAIVPY